MKTLKILLTALVAILLFSCETEGPIGPPGQDGINGKDGVNIVGTIIDIEGDFSPDNDYKLSYAFPSKLKVYATDVVLVYILWETAKIDGKDVDVWRLLPQTVILTEGVLQYNYDHTLRDVNIFLEGTNEVLSALKDTEKNNQVFRIAIMPAAELEAKSIDINNIEAVAQNATINLTKVPRYSIQ